MSRKPVHVSVKLRAPNLEIQRHRYSTLSKPEFQHARHSHNAYSSTCNCHRHAIKDTLTLPGTHTFSSFLPTVLRSVTCIFRIQHLMRSRKATITSSLLYSTRWWHRDISTPPYPSLYLCIAHYKCVADHLFAGGWAVSDPNRYVATPSLPTTASGGRSRLCSILKPHNLFGVLGRDSRVIQTLQIDDSCFFFFYFFFYRRQRRTSPG